jgi:ABC-type sugar transport system permease subunit
MATDLNTGILVVFVLLLGGLGVANLVESKESRQKFGQTIFGTMYLLMAVALVLYKIKNR